MALQSFNNLFSLSPRPKPEVELSTFETILPTEVKVSFLDKVSISDLARFERVSSNCRAAAALVWISIANRIEQSTSERTWIQAKIIIKQYYSGFHALPIPLFRLLGGVNAVLDTPKNYCLKKGVEPSMELCQFLGIDQDFGDNVEGFVPPKNFQAPVSVTMKLSLVKLADEFDVPHLERAVALFNCGFSREVNSTEYKLLSKIVKLTAIPECLEVITNIFTKIKFDPLQFSAQNLKKIIRQEDPIFYRKYISNVTNYAAEVEVLPAADSRKMARYVYFNQMHISTLWCPRDHSKTNMNNVVDASLRHKLLEKECGKLPALNLKTRLHEVKWGNDTLSQVATMFTPNKDAKGSFWGNLTNLLN